jgi:hypothetical protein
MTTHQHADAAHQSTGLRRLHLDAAVTGLLAMVLLLAGCGNAEDRSLPPTTSSPPTAYTELEPAELAAMPEKKNFVLINSHVPYEGAIEQADLFLPFDRAVELVDRLPADKAEAIAVYCRSDRMSRIAAEEWARAGDTDLYRT